MVAIVTGASGDIGNSIMEYLLNKGFKVYAFYNNNEIKLEKHCSENKMEVIPVKCNFVNLNEVEQAIKSICQNEDIIDVLVNCAGVSNISQIQDLEINKYVELININLNAPFVLTKYVSQKMISQKSGNIINISSIWGEVGASCEVAYSMSKAGLDGMTKALAKELGPSNIRVNSIAPGLIKTKMNKQLDMKQIIEEIPLNKVGTCKDVVDGVDFVLNCNYITGQVIHINGGW